MIMESEYVLCINSPKKAPTYFYSFDSIVIRNRTPKIIAES